MFDWIKRKTKLIRKRPAHRVRIFFDYHFRRTPKEPYLLLCSRRSGSNLLLSYLNSIPGVSFQGELLNPDMAYGLRWRYISKRAALNHLAYSINALPARICGAKLMYFRLAHHGITLDNLSERLPEAKYLVVYRRSLLEQFVSLKIAQQTNEWQWSSKFQLPSSVEIEPAELQIFCSKMRAFYRSIFAHAWISGRMAVVEYESLTARPQEIFEKIVFPFLGIKPCRVTSPLKKQNTRPLDKIISNYDEIRPLLDNDLLFQEYSFDGSAQKKARCVSTAGLRTVIRTN